MRVIVAAIAEIEQVIAGFEAELAINVLKRGGALKTSKVLVLKSVGEEEDTLVFSLFF